jgi:hypothetical protein
VAISFQVEKKGISGHQVFKQKKIKTKQNLVVTKSLSLKNKEIIIIIIIIILFGNLMAIRSFNAKPQEKTWWPLGRSMLNHEGRLGGH